MELRHGKGAGVGVHVIHGRVGAHNLLKYAARSMIKSQLWYESWIYIKVKYLGLTRGILAQNN